jgi:hypothetical protein
MNFSCSAKLNLPFESLVQPPSELDCKNFFRALQVACGAAFTQLEGSYF